MCVICVLYVCEIIEIWCKCSNNYAICKVIIAKKKSQYLTFFCKCRLFCGCAQYYSFSQLLRHVSWRFLSSKNTKPNKSPLAIWLSWLWWICHTKTIQLNVQSTYFRKGQSVCSTNCTNVYIPPATLLYTSVKLFHTAVLSANPMAAVQYI